METKNFIENSETVSAKQHAKSIANFRAVICSETANMEMDDPNNADKITKLSSDMLDRVAVFENEVTGRSEGMSSAEILYKPLFPDVSPITEIARLYEIINKYDKHLENAIKLYDDEAYREIEMTLFCQMPYELDYLNISNSNIGEVATAMKVAFYSNKTNPYRREQIMSLRKVLDFIRKDISVGEKPLMEILSTLDDHFDLTGSFRDISYYE